jgi:hypothetical protein
MKPEFKIIDPRRGEDWVETTRKGVRVSIRDQNLLLLRYIPSKKARPFELADFDDFIRVSMQCTGSIGFFSVSSFNGPLRAACPLSDEVIETYGSAMGYFPLEVQKIDHYQGLKRAVSFEVLIVGSARRRLPQAVEPWKTYPWDIDYLLDQLENLGCFFRFDGETETLEVFTRLYPDIDSYLERLGQRR